MRGRKAHGIVCPGCGESGSTMVKDSRQRDVEGFSVVYRRRVCLACDHRWTTYESDAAAFERALRLVAAARALSQAITDMKTD